MRRCRQGNIATYAIHMQYRVDFRFGRCMGINLRECIQKRMQHLESFRRHSKYLIANLFDNIQIVLKYQHHCLCEWARTPKRIQTLRKIMWHSYIRHDYTTAHILFFVLDKQKAKRRKDARRIEIIKTHFENYRHECFILQHRNENISLPYTYLCNTLAKTHMCKTKVFNIAKSLQVWYANYKQNKHSLMEFQIEGPVNNGTRHFVKPDLWQQLHKSPNV